MNRLIGFGLVLSLGVSGALAACGGDSSSGSGGTGGTAVAGAGGTSGGSGGTTGGSAGTGAGGTTGGSAGTGAGGTTGGSAGTGAGGTGGSATGGTGGNGGSVMCGTEGCNDYNIMGFITIPACCPDGVTDKCGVDVSQAEQFIGITGCMEENAPGVLDTNCPPNTPFSGFTFPGCCLPTGVCGNAVDTSGFGGPNMGCVNINEFTDAGASPSCGSGTGGTGGGAN